MRLRDLLVGGAMLAVAATRAGAQCASASVSARDLCTKASDIYQFLMPQLGGALAGGSAMPGQPTTLGGLGHFAIGVRAAAINGALPNVDNVSFSTTGAAPSNLGGDSQLIPMPTVDVGIGVFSGVNLGVTRIGSVDALIGVTYLPNVDGDGVKLSVDNALAFGFGARVGILEEGALWPSVAVTYAQRRLPTASVTGTSTVSAAGGSGPGSFTLSDLDVKANSWRIQAGKNLMLLGLTAGFGQDRLDNSTAISGAVTPAVGGVARLDRTTLSQSLTRGNVFVGASINLPLVRIGAEVGQQSGGDIARPTNRFGEDAAKSRTYLSVGLRFKL